MSEDENNIFHKKYNKPFKELEDKERQPFFKHYDRCEKFWRHWTTTIWSIPSVASAINIGAYTLIFTSDMTDKEKIILAGILSLLNLALTLGLWKHQNMQKKFGQQIIDAEDYASIPVIDYGNFIKHWSGSWAYVLAMIFITLISLVFNINLLFANKIIPVSIHIPSNCIYFIPIIGLVLVVLYVIFWPPIKICYIRIKKKIEAKRNAKNAQSNSGLPVTQDTNGSSPQQR